MSFRYLVVLFLSQTMDPKRNHRLMVIISYLKRMIKVRMKFDLVFYALIHVILRFVWLLLSQVRRL